MSDPTNLSAVRASFRTALAQIEAYPVALDWRPAFMSPLGALSRIQRAPLPDLSYERPARKPFAGQSLTLATAVRGIRNGSLPAVAVMEQALDAIDRRQPELNAFVYVAPRTELLEAAAAADRSVRDGKMRGPLLGIPIAVKDLLAVAGMPNTASSPVLADRMESNDAGSIQLLKAAGAIITGKTQTHEFALGVTTPQSRNPWDATRDPGGSSGGSAIAVATGMSLGAMATDTRASVRVPASLCGVVGYKPTFGLVPGDGVIMLSWSLDHVAHMAANVEDAAIMLNVLDPTSHVDYTSALSKNVRGLRVGVPTAALQGADPDVVTAFGNAVLGLRESGVTVVEIDTPTEDDFDLAVLMGLVVSRCEAAAYHTAFGERRSQYATAVVAEQLDEASHVSAVAYLQAQRAREDLRRRMFEQIGLFDALLMPTTRVAAPKSTDVDNYFLVLSQNCILWSFIGFPVISVPCGWTPNGLPVGAQLVAGPFEDQRLLALAAALETKLGE
ncbi:MAG: amidase [Anaerolineales bacterium]|nr:amidase [Anaerolineales bacterium]